MCIVIVIVIIISIIIFHLHLSAKMHFAISNDKGGPFIKVAGISKALMINTY